MKFDSFFIGYSLNRTVKNLTLTNIHTGFRCQFSQNKDIPTKTVCGGKTSRESHALTSSINEIEVRIVSPSSPQDMPMFLLKVEGML